MSSSTNVNVMLPLPVSLDRHTSFLPRRLLSDLIFNPHRGGTGDVWPLLVSRGHLWGVW